jgi:hypothetical protein
MEPGDVAGPLLYGFQNFLTENARNTPTLVSMAWEEVLVTFRDMLTLRERVEALRFFHSKLADLSQRIDSDDLLLVDVPGELRRNARACQMMLNDAEEKLLSLEASAELYEADLKRRLDELRACEHPYAVEG